MHMPKVNYLMNLLRNTLKIITLHKVTSNARKLFVCKAWLNATKTIVCISLSFEISDHLFSFKCFLLLISLISFVHL